MSTRSYHIPQGDPCNKCGLPALNHRADHKCDGEPCIKCGLPSSKHRIREREDTRVEHESIGDPCDKCGLPESKHRVRIRTRIEHKPDGDPCKKCGEPENKHRFRSYDDRIGYIGIDGEGQGRRDHRYVLLAASNEKGDRTWAVESERLSTEECLDLILTLPSKRNKIFAFSFNYDLTKILTDLDNKSLFLLFRPELRPRKGPDAKKGPMPVKWKNYRLNLQGTKFTVRKGRKRVIIWDLFKFFQAKFVNALKDWKVGNKELWDRMSLMKDKRNEFDKESMDAIKAYCLEECKCIAELARKLVESHETAGLKLKSFYGAGSSGAAMLTAMNIKEQITDPPPEMKIAVAAAFSGGRFENSIIGQTEGICYNRDISSAYPYHITFLPCLLHGKWRLTKNRYEMDSARAAVIHYGLGNSSIQTWGPFPFRTNDGSISYPIESGGGWVWKEEYLSGERIFPHIEFREAWIYECDCDCQPFKDIPRYYILRLQLGKEGPGIVIKLGCNSCYGKLAQSIGNAIFNSWIWAGMITSGCRAQVLDMLGLHKDWSNLLAVATDGLYSREKIIAPIPKDTGTGNVWVFDEKLKREALKPVLGGWEEKIYKKGMFFARPGIYFPLNPTQDDIKDVRGRGVGKGVILENWDKIIDIWEKEKLDGIVSIQKISRFCGAKTCISVSGGGKIFKRANHVDPTKPRYGQWIQRKIEMSFHPMPKREKVNPDGLTLELRRFPRDLESVPYDRAMISRETADLRACALEASEQPDGDMAEYD